MPDRFVVTLGHYCEIMHDLSNWTITGD